MNCFYRIVLSAFVGWYIDCKNVPGMSHIMSTDQSHSMLRISCKELV